MLLENQKQLERKILLHLCSRVGMELIEKVLDQEYSDTLADMEGDPRRREEVQV
jgi:hypothetical protein